MAKTYRTPSVVTLGSADTLTLGHALGTRKENIGSTSESLLDL